MANIDAIIDRMVEEDLATITSQKFPELIFRACHSRHNRLYAIAYMIEKEVWDSSTFVEVNMYPSEMFFGNSNISVEVTYFMELGI